MIDVFVCVKPRPRYSGRRRSSIRDRQGCVSRGWNKEVIVESIGLVRVYHRSNPLHACTNFNRNNFHAHLLPPPPPTRMKNSKKIGLFDPIPCNKIYRGGSRGRLGSARSIIPSNWDQADDFVRFSPLAKCIIRHLIRCFFFFNKFNSWKAYERGHLRGKGGETRLIYILKGI